MKSRVIAISREYGSGGRLVGAKLAEELGMEFYDKAIISMAAEKSGLSPEFVERSEEMARSSFLYSIVMAGSSESSMLSPYTVPTGDKAFFAMSDIIREVAAKGNAVIVGRCADFILRDREDCLKVFVFGDKETRIQRLVKYYGLSEQEAPDRLKKIDKARANYYRYYTGETWGRAHAYDLAVNTGTLGVEKAVEIIKAAYTAE